MLTCFSVNVLQCTVLNSVHTYVCAVVRWCVQWSGVEGCDACAQLEAAGCPGCTDCCPSPHCKLSFLQFIGKPSTVRYSRFSEEETSPKDSHGMEEDGSGSSSEDKRHEQVCCVSVCVHKCCHTLLFELPHQCRM